MRDETFCSYISATSELISWSLFLMWRENKPLIYWSFFCCCWEGKDWWIFEQILQIVFSLSHVDLFFFFFFGMIIALVRFGPDTSKLFLQLLCIMEYYLIKFKLIRSTKSKYCTEVFEIWSVRFSFQSLSTTWWTLIMFWLQNFSRD